MTKHIQPRIIAGKFKGIRLSVSDSSRPITDRMKQSLFDQITDYTQDAHVLDLYAGSGSLGLEALSRGSSFATFVENEHDAQETLAKNIAKCQAENITEIVKRNALGFVKDTKDQFDLIFIDPPYRELEEREFPLHMMYDLMHPQSLLVMKLATDYNLKPLKSLPLLLEQQFGQNKLVYIQKKEH